MKDFEPAPLDVPVVDVWPPGRYNAAVRYAYREAGAAGRIRIERTVRDPNTGAIIVRYLADIPEAWIRTELGGYKRQWNGDQIAMEVDP